MTDAEELPKIKDLDDEDFQICTISFSPPVYQQRYRVILDLVSGLKPKKVADFGCAECKFIQLLRQEDVEEICGIDIDEDVLTRAMRHIEPFVTDYLHPRKTPLSVRLYKGSISEFDDVLRGCDMVTMIEVIEHLFPKELENFPSVVFQKIKPMTVVITTPNADFNVLFQCNGQFRHWDHKFEWNRKQFAEWCETICLAYHYRYVISGIGKGPEGTEKLGCCSQMAVFTRITRDSNLSVKDCNSNIRGTSYKLIKESIYPYETECEIRKREVARVLMECVNDIKTIYVEKESNGQLRHFENNNVSISKRNSVTPGQFDDADNDNSFLAEDMTPISNGYFRFPIMSQRLSKPQKFFRYHQEANLVQGQFDDVMDQFSVGYDNSQLIHKTYNDPSIGLVNCDIIIPIQTLLQFKLLQEFKITEDDVRTYTQTHAQLRLSEDNQSVLIYPYFNEEKSLRISPVSETTDEESIESNDNAESIFSITDFYEENWDE